MQSAVPAYLVPERWGQSWMATCGTMPVQESAHLARVFLDPLDPDHTCSYSSKVTYRPRFRLTHDTHRIHQR